LHDFSAILFFALALPKKVGVHFVRGGGRRENSPAIYRWGSVGQSIQSAKRTTESQVQDFDYR